jgi:serine protease Do
MKRHSKLLSQIVIAIIIIMLLATFSITIVLAQSPTPSATPAATVSPTTPSPTPTASPAPTGSPTAPVTGQPINPNWTPPSPASTSPTVQTTSKVVADVRPAVVAIDVSVTSLDYFNRPITQQGAGSGWIIDTSGIIVTNNHVVEGANSVSITLNDGRIFSASAVAADPTTDVAVIKINASNLTAAAIGNSSNLQVGQTVVAIGNSLGMGISATQGIISALGITISPESQPLYGLIQTDAAINPGNSGGPLLNLSEEVMGIDSAKISQSGVEGMGYAIAINEAMPIIQQLIQKGTVSRAYLGVSLQTVTPAIAAQFGLAVKQGALIVRVATGSPASQGGLKAGDVITAINGQTVNTAADVTKIIRSSQVGQQLQITYYRDTSQSNTTVTTVQAPTQ